MRIMSRLHHPCIATVIGAILEDKSCPWVVFECMDMGTLYDVLHNETVNLEPEVSMPILIDIVQGMSFLHSRSPAILHRDLKASNILLGRRMNAKVADFGFSGQTTLWSSDVIWGTPFFLAPELITRKSEANPSTDVYAFGITLFEIFSRKQPYDGMKTNDVLAAVSDTTRREEFR